MKVDHAAYRAAIQATLAETDITGLSAESVFAVLIPHFDPAESRRAASKAVAGSLPIGWRWVEADRRLAELSEPGRSAAQAAAHWRKVASADGFVFRIGTHYHAERRFAEMLALASKGPRWQQWKLATVGSPITPRQCAERSGSVGHFSSPIWSERPACWRPDCSCRLARAR